MFKNLTDHATGFLGEIRMNNNKEWFEAHKKEYLEHVYEPLKELGAELFKPFSDTEGMMYKTARIYRDATFPPFLHYRDVMWIYIRYDAMYWNKTPTLFFELSPEGAEFGFRIAKPEPKLMEMFRSDLADDPRTFLDMVKLCEENHAMILSGEEYKRCKPCSSDELIRFFNKKGIALSVTVPSGKELYGDRLLPHINEVFHALIPINDYFHELVLRCEAEKLLRSSASAETQPEERIIKAPQQDFMW